jgi:NADH dehydrogenase (ubiquinone) 1 alpha subcomplex subunit 8
MSPETAHSRRVRLPAHQLLITKQKLEKKIPGAPANEVPVHERKRQIYAQSITTQ